VGRPAAGRPGVLLVGTVDRFSQDDFAWLSLACDSSRGESLAVAVRAGSAGTIRPLSERAFFLVFHQLSGSMPSRTGSGCTQPDGRPAVAGVIARKLTGSRVAGFCAPVLGSQRGRGCKLSWTSTYNQILLAFFLRWPSISCCGMGEAGSATTFTNGWPSWPDWGRWRRAWSTRDRCGLFLCCARRYLLGWAICRCCRRLRRDASGGGARGDERTIRPAPGRLRLSNPMEILGSAFGATLAAPGCLASQPRAGWLRFAKLCGGNGSRCS
jgi:hypothetical protein